MAFEAGLVLPVLAPERAWRRLLMLASIPGLVAFALALFFLDESRASLPCVSLGKNLM